MKTIIEIEGIRILKNIEKGKKTVKTLCKSSNVTYTNVFLFLYQDTKREGSDFFQFYCEIEDGQFLQKLAHFFHTY